MRYLGVFIIALSLFAKEYTVMIEPYETYHIKADVTGKVLFSDIESEGKSVKDKQIIKIDDKIDRYTLHALERKYQILKSSLANEQRRATLLKQLLKIKKSNYDRIKNLKTKSLFEKEQRLADYLGTQNSYYSQLSRIKSLKQQLEDIALNIAKSKDQIDKKNIKISGYIYKIYPKKGDVVTIGAPLVDVADISKAKITLFLTKEELSAKEIIIDGKRGYSFDRVWIVPDSEHLGLYKAQILLPQQAVYGKFVKVEIQ